MLFALALPLTGICADDAADTDANILIRTAVKPPTKIVIGQRVILQVDVLAADGWAQIKDVRDFSVAGAQVVRYASQGTRLNETIHGRAFSGQRYELSLFPWQAGTISLPSIPVVVEVSRWGSDAGKTTQRLKTPQAAFEVNTPPGAEGIKGLISTPSLEAVQHWVPEQKKFKLGEAIKRTIELSGRDISGMAFTPLDFESTDMVSIYAAEPRVDDRFDRGTLRGTRVESVTYVFTREGAVELPEIVVPWWDIDQNELKQAVLPALTLEIASSPMATAVETDGAATESSRALSRLMVAALTALVLLLILVIIFHDRLQGAWTQWQQTRREDEHYYFRQFARAARSDEPDAVYNHLMRWLDRIHDGPGAARLDEFLSHYGDEAALNEMNRLQQALYKANSGWSGKPLVAAMRLARRRWRQTKSPKQVDLALPPLNP
jgi:hypothetical protein